MTQDETLVVLFADICNSTVLYEVKGDTVAHEQIDKALKVLAKITTKHHGNVIKTIGDEVLVTGEIGDEGR